MDLCMIRNMSGWSEFYMILMCFLINMCMSWLPLIMFCIYVSVQKIDAVINVRLVLFKSNCSAFRRYKVCSTECVAMKPQIINTGLQNRQFSTDITESRQFPCSWCGSKFRSSPILSIPIIRTTLSLWDTKEYSGKIPCHNTNNRLWYEKRRDWMLRTASPPVGTCPPEQKVPYSRTAKIYLQSINL